MEEAIVIRSQNGAWRKAVITITTGAVYNSVVFADLFNKHPDCKIYAGQTALCVLYNRHDYPCSWLFVVSRIVLLNCIITAWFVRSK